MIYDQYEYLQQVKSGKVLKCAQEFYLRDDIPCGSRLCPTCVHDIAINFLEAKPQRFSSKFNFQHYLVLDTNIILHQVGFTIKKYNFQLF